MATLGNKIQAERRNQSMTLKQLSEKTKLSIGFLSEIERDLAQPSMASLRKIAQGLGISLMSFQVNNEESNQHVVFSLDREQKKNQYIEDIRVVRAGQRKKIAYPGTDSFYEMLTPDLNRRLEVLYGRAKPGFHSGPPIVDPPGEKFIFVIKGSYDLTIAGVTYHLSEGDSIYYPADAPVSWRVSGDEACETILVITPPGF